MATFGKRIEKPNLSSTSVAPNKGEKQAEDAEKSESLTVEERFEVRSPRFKMEDLILSQVVLDELLTLQSRIENHKVIYDDWAFGAVDSVGRNVAVNLYGPSGTGKTSCAEALAHRLGQDVIEVNYAEIESKYVGETPKNIVAAFKQATEHGAVLFFDEADSILGRRMTNVTQSADHGVNVARAVMLKQLDAFAGVVIFATNLARNFDGAFVRRILQHVLIGPPDEACRRRLWERMVTAKVPGRNGLDFEHLAKSSDGLTGGLIKNAVLLALSAVAMRPKIERFIAPRDIEDAIDSVKRAQRDVGHAQVEWQAVSTQTDPT